MLIPHLKYVPGELTKRLQLVLSCNVKHKNSWTQMNKILNKNQTNCKSCHNLILTKESQHAQSRNRCCWTAGAKVKTVQLTGGKQDDEYVPSQEGAAARGLGGSGSGSMTGSTLSGDRQLSPLHGGRVEIEKTSVTIRWSFYIREFRQHNVMCEPNCALRSHNLSNQQDQPRSQESKTQEKEERTRLKWD